MNIKYYDINELLENYEGQYYMIFGQRSNGKSFSVTRYCIDNFFKSGMKEEFSICKRYAEDMKPKIVTTILDDHKEYILEKYNYEIKYYRGKWYVYPSNTDGRIEDCVIMCRGFSISDSDKYKATQYPKVKYIILEEFMSMNSNYLPNEIHLFVNLVSTIFRNRIGCKVFMLGNAIARVSPYTKALGVRLDRMKHGSVLCREFKDDRGYKTSFVIQRCENVDVFNKADNIDKVTYSVFGNNNYGKMITTGEFETGIFRKHIFNLTLKKNLSTCPNNDIAYKIINDEGSVTNIYVVFEGYIYRCIIKYENICCAFEEVEIIDNEDTVTILNTFEYLPNAYNVTNLVNMIWDDNFYPHLKQLKIILSCVLQDRFIVESNEDGQNIIDAFISMGVNQLKTR